MPGCITACHILLDFWYASLCASAKQGRGEVSMEGSGRGLKKSLEGEKKMSSNMYNCGRLIDLEN